MKWLLANLAAGVAFAGGVAVTAQPAQKPAGAKAGTAAAGAALDRNILHVQVILDKLGFGPGILDGRPGMSLTAALKGYQ
jgi:peptidoglycan hydrolase-like protein with peptidoglycan-binding domain